MVRADAISGESWAVIEPMLPSTVGKRGGRFTDHRMVLEGIVWRFRTGSPWRDVPADFGPWQTLWKRFDRWAADGTFDAILVVLQGNAQASADLEWVASVDSSIMRAHQHAAGARRRREGQGEVEQHTGGPVELQGSAA
jgi:putative transposase